MVSVYGQYFLMTSSYMPEIFQKYAYMILKRENKFVQPYCK